MTNFIYNNTTVPINKMNAAPLPPGANPAQWGVASEWITLCQALLDVQGWARGAQWMGMVPLALDPAPAGVADYVWLRDDDTWMHNNTPLGGGGGGTVTSVGTGVGLTGGPITGSGTINLANTAVTPGAYTNVNLTVDAQGRITSATNGTAPTAPAIIFDDSVPATNKNIRSDRGGGTQSPIDNTKIEITNFGSTTGGSNGATGQGATIGGGLDNDATGLFYPTVAGGTANLATNGYASIGGGQGNEANGISSTVGGGQGNVANADRTTVGGGDANQATAEWAAVGGGAYNTAQGCWSTVSGGLAADAKRHGQMAFSVGDFTGGPTPISGEAQTSLMVLRGVTPGVAINETYELDLGADGVGVGWAGLELEDGKAYAFKVTAVVGAVQTGPVRASRSIEIKFNARRDAGLTVITASGVGEAYGDASTSTWTLTPSVGAAPDRIVLTFNTGAGALSASHIVAKVEFTEAVY